MKNATSLVFRNHNRSALPAGTYNTHRVIYYPLVLSIFSFLNESFLFQNSTLLCRQNRIFIDMSYFLKIAGLSPVLLTKRLLTTALKNSST